MFMEDHTALWKIRNGWIHYVVYESLLPFWVKCILYVCYDFTFFDPDHAISWAKRRIVTL